MNWEEAADETERDILDDLMDVNYPATDYLIDRAIEEIVKLRNRLELRDKCIINMHNELIELHRKNDERER